MKIIGLTGEARAGKDTTADFIREIYYANSVGFPTIKVTGFAHALKLSVARLFLSDPTLDDALEFCDWLKTDGRVQVFDDSGRNSQSLKYERNITGRRLLQLYGTEAHRNTFGEDFWLDAVLPAGRDDCDLLVICDARFENEVQRIRDRGGEVWRIERPAHKNPSDVGAHASEQAVPDEYVTRTIVNDCGIRELHDAVYQALLSAVPA